jgi:threonine dehydratase
VQQEFRTDLRRRDDAHVENSDTARANRCADWPARLRGRYFPAPITARSAMFTLTLRDFEETRARIAAHIKHTPLLTSRQLSDATGFDVRLKAEMFQRVGSYKIRGPLNKFALMPEEQKRRGVVCSSAGNHAQGVALAAKIHGIRAVVCMAENATPAKIAATRAYGAEVVLHGTIWDEANEKAKELVRTEGLTYVHPFDDEQLIAGQGTLGLEIVQDWPEVDAVVVPIGGGGLISGVSMAVKSHNPRIKVIGVESSDGPAMKASLEAGKLETIDCRTIIDGLRVRRAGEINFSVVQRFVDEIVALPDKEIFEAMLWVMERCKLVLEGAAAAPVAAMLHGLVDVPPGSKIVAVLSGGNVNLDQLRGLRWN